MNQDYIYVTGAEKAILEQIRSLPAFSQLKIRKHSSKPNAYYVDLDFDETFEFSEATLLKALRATDDIEEIKIKSKERRGKTWDIQITRSRSSLLG